MNTHVPDDPTALDHTLEVPLGRRAPFTRVGDWILLSGADSDARTLYRALPAHLNTSRDDDGAWPALLALARILGLKRPENVAEYMLQREVIGAIEVIRSITGLVRRNRDIVHQTPPVDYRGPRSMADGYAVNRAVPDEAFDSWRTATLQTLEESCRQTAHARAKARENHTLLPPAIPFFGLDSRTHTESASRAPGDGLTRRRKNTTKNPRLRRDVSLTAEGLIRHGLRAAELAQAVLEGAAGREGPGAAIPAPGNQFGV
ncbi:hypothetical protein ACFV2H_20950 [Streptomyces sp. NPDC059629]|uniref:hypothetical protein n=1 Tax=Streptomyces sp. NPDC059629 TaxID=3346889 RepID=UPI0036C5060A